ncbi:MAG: GNAT family N-acetyltransferase [Armatimonadetes bacterium]|nr:GNAT family N-acetyltransferase [Armatimonadota bacterium]
MRIDSDDLEAYRHAEMVRLQASPPGRITWEADGSAYLTAWPGLREGLSGAVQTAVQDFGWRPGRADAAARLLGDIDGVVVADCAIDDDERAELLEAAGFVPEIVRVRRRVSETPHDPEFTSRACGPGDLPFLFWLASETCAHTVPRVRGWTDDEVRDAFMRRYATLDMDACPTLILEDARKESCGFVVFEMDYVDPASGRVTAFILDIATHPDYWGKGAAQAMMRAGEAEMRRRGVRTMFADISADNPRPLARATKSLGFEMVGHQWVRIPKL